MTHDQVLWIACLRAAQELDGTAPFDPGAVFPYLIRGSWMNDMNQASKLLDRADVAERPKQPILFHGLWKLELEDLLNRRALRYPRNQTLLAARGGILATPQNVDGFGPYRTRCSCRIIR
jgi:hypothetical protein